MKIAIQAHQLEFIQVPMRFQRHSIINLFAEKNNKTVAETLSHRRYTSLLKEVHHHYPNSLDDKLGEFLYGLKISNDRFYLRFLNEYGDGEFCDFLVEKTILTQAKGVYCFMLDEKIKYFGRSHDPFERRLNQGYGHISPKNCYRDGQSTNCHLNSLIAQNYAVICFYVFPLDDDLAIDRLERLLISSYKPEWNRLL